MMMDANTGMTLAISMYRIHKYPKTSPEMAKKSRGTGAHTDFGAMTLLLQDDSEATAARTLSWC